MLSLFNKQITETLQFTYSGLPITRLLKEVKKRFELSGVQNKKPERRKNATFTVFLFIQYVYIFIKFDYREFEWERNSTFWINQTWPVFEGIIIKTIIWRKRKLLRVVRDIEGKTTANVWQKSGRNRIWFELSRYYMLYKQNTPLPLGSENNLA